MLVIRNLKFSYQQFTLFEGLNFELKGGDVLHLQGSNGSGKSTLLSLIAGLRNAYEGQISFFSDLNKEVPDRRSRIAYLGAENNGLYGRMSAKENIRFWSSLNEITLPAEAKEKSLSEWGLSKPLLETMPVCRFSTGMKRRLGLARVFLLQRDCLLLDEPLNGLDAQGVRVFQKCVEAHLAKNGFIVLVSHETQAIKSFVTKELLLS